MIQGFFKDDAGFVNVHLVSSSIDVDDTITFLVDTGASKTTLLDKDAARLGIEQEKLKRSGQDLFGIGGSIPTYVLEDAELLFHADTGTIELKIPIFIVRHPLEKLSKEERVKVLRVPSLLGRDIINKYKMTFNFSKELSLTKK
jgi:hypothetical protein